MACMSVNEAFELSPLTSNLRHLLSFTAALIYPALTYLSCCLLPIPFVLSLSLGLNLRGVKASRFALHFCELFVRIGKIGLT